MSSSTSRNVLPPPELSSYQPGASSPQQSAMMQMNSMNQKQASLNKIGGASSTQNSANLTVPQFKDTYTNQNGNASTNNQIKQNYVLANQAGANSQYDNYATQMGGKRKYYHKSRHTHQRRNKSRHTRHTHHRRDKSRHTRHTRRRYNKKSRR